MTQQEPRLNEEEAQEAPRGAKGRRRNAGELSGAREQRLAAERESNDRESDDQELSEAERLELLRDSLIQSALPDLPILPGYHVCWLSTTNKRDSIAWRQRLGYRLIRIEELPGWEGTHIKSGDLAGVVAVEEMVAAKIPLDRYNRFMRMLHHDMPLEEEQKLRASIKGMKEQAQQAGGDIIEGDGTAQIVQRARPMPAFTS